LKTDEELYSGKELTEEIRISNNKPNVVFISSNNFKKIWDNVLLEVYSNKFFFTLSKYWLTKWILNKIICSKIQKTFGDQVKKIHILNEELGFYVLDILKHSRIMFSSSYGFLEQGNFLAFKDPELFHHKDFIYKPGGTLLKDNDFLFKEVFIDEYNSSKTTTGIIIGEACVKEEISTGIVKSISSGDLGMMISNIPNQGDRKYLYIYGRKFRDPLSHKVSLDLVERFLKDTLLIRDCFLRKHVYNSDVVKYELFIELREDLFDIKHISWKDVQFTIKDIVNKLQDSAGIEIESYAILKFNGMRNIAGKLQYYIL
jgi:hypothetical protein